MINDSSVISYLHEYTTGCHIFLVSLKTSFRNSVVYIWKVDRIRFLFVKFHTISSLRFFFVVNWKAALKRLSWIKTSSHPAFWIPNFSRFDQNKRLLYIDCFLFDWLEADLILLQIISRNFKKVSRLSLTTFVLAIKGGIKFC